MSDKKTILKGRLKDLMKVNKVSNRELSAETEKLGFRISPATITEICADKEKGFDYRYFKVLAEYFNTTTDYLLGLTDVREKDEPELRAVCDYTGLSDDAMNLLLEFVDEYGSDGLVSLLEINKEVGKKIFRRG